MDEQVLSDPKVEPTDEVLAACLGRSKGVLDAALLHLRTRCPGSEARWRYYRDGKSWLLSASWKKKTLFWLSADHGAFRVTFYLPSSLEAALAAADLPAPVKSSFAASAGKKIRGATAVIRTPSDLSAFDTLLALKLSAR